MTGETGMVQGLDINVGALETKRSWKQAVKRTAESLDKAQGLQDVRELLKAHEKETRAIARTNDEKPLPAIEDVTGAAYAEFPVVPQEWIIPYIVPKYSYGTWYGGPGSQKTMAAQTLAVLRATKTSVRLWDWEIPVGGRTMIISAEEEGNLVKNPSEAELPRRQKAIVDSIKRRDPEAEFDGRGIVYLGSESVDGRSITGPRGEPTPFCEELIEYIKDAKCDLVFLETFNRICRIENSNDDSAAGNVINTIHKIKHETGATVIIIDHQNKAGRGSLTEEAALNSLSGSGAKSNNPRFSMCFSSQKRAADGKPVTQIIFTKAKGAEKPQTFTYKFDFPEFILLSEKAGKEASLEEHILKYVKSQAPRGVPMSEIKTYVPGGNMVKRQEETLRLYREGKLYRRKEARAFLYFAEQESEDLDLKDAGKDAGNELTHLTDPLKEKENGSVNTDPIHYLFQTPSLKQKGQFGSVGSVRDKSTEKPSNKLAGEANTCDRTDPSRCGSFQKGDGMNRKSGTTEKEKDKKRNLKDEANTSATGTNTPAEEEKSAEEQVEDMIKKMMAEDLKIH